MTARNKDPNRPFALDRFEEITPTDLQTEHLADRAGIPADELAELTLGEIRDHLEGMLDPGLLGYRQICGRVVRRNPATGTREPVPYATVHVEDTDCNFLFYAPGGYSYVWSYPWGCSTEELATVRTDECGHFCVWIPRWDIDRVVRWRERRFCFPELEPPRVIDVVDDLFHEPDDIRWPGPGRPHPRPDPEPEISDLELRQELASRLGNETGTRLMASVSERVFGAYRGDVRELLREPAPQEALPVPPVPPGEEELGQLPDDAEINLYDPLGPFRRCVDVHVPEWTTVTDVPDITFRVTQMQEGTRVTIYDEGYFDVRWDDASTSDVTLLAGPRAVSVSACEGPEVDCETDPAITSLSEMPLLPGYHDDTPGDVTFGYGLRVNQPSSNGIDAPTAGPGAGDAQAPYADRVDLYGCFHIGDSTHYRVLYSYEGGPRQPITGVNFPVLTTGSPPTVDWQRPDSDGWYRIRDDLTGLYEHLILPWPTRGMREGDGTYELQLVVGSRSGGSISREAASDEWTFEVDNSRPAIDDFNISGWIEDQPGSKKALSGPCPVIGRRDGGSEQTLVIEIEWSASARHLRSARLTFTGCGGGNSPSAETGRATRRWWWENLGDRSTSTKVARFKIPAENDGGCYTVRAEAVSRAFNPDIPRSLLSSDWYTRESRRQRHRSKSISVVDAPFNP